MEDPKNLPVLRKGSRAKRHEFHKRLPRNNVPVGLQQMLQQTDGKGLRWSLLHRSRRMFRF